jgi:hypothetical protein
LIVQNHNDLGNLKQKTSMRELERGFCFENEGRP